jgi:hypothetical protein
MGRRLAAIPLARRELAAGHSESPSAFCVWAGIRRTLRRNDCSRPREGAEAVPTFGQHLRLLRGEEKKETIHAVEWSMRTGSLWRPMTA